MAPCIAITWDGNEPWDVRRNEVLCKLLDMTSLPDTIYMSCLCVLLCPLPTHTRQFFSSPLQKFSFAQYFTSSHRHKNDELHKIFHSLPDTEKLIDGTL